MANNKPPRCTETLPDLVLPPTEPLRRASNPELPRRRTRPTRPTVKQANQPLPCTVEVTNPQRAPTTKRRSQDLPSLTRPRRQRRASPRAFPPSHLPVRHRDPRSTAKLARRFLPEPSRLVVLPRACGTLACLQPTLSTRSPSRAPRALATKQVSKLARLPRVSVPLLPPSTQVQPSLVLVLIELIVPLSPNYRLLPRRLVKKRNLRLRPLLHVLNHREIFSMPLETEEQMTDIPIFAFTGSLRLAQQLASRLRPSNPSRRPVSTRNTSRPRSRSPSPRLKLQQLSLRSFPNKVSLRESSEVSLASWRYFETDLSFGFL